MNITLENQSHLFYSKGTDHKYIIVSKDVNWSSLGCLKLFSFISRLSLAPLNLVPTVEHFRFS